MSGAAAGLLWAATALGGKGYAALGRCRHSLLLLPSRMPLSGPPRLT